MAPRNPLRPKAAQIPNDKFLESVDAYRDRRGQFPVDLWVSRGYPGKVVLEKAYKLRHRGYLSLDWYVTKAGRVFLEEQHAKEDA